MKGRIARPIEELDDDSLKAIATSFVGPERAALKTGLGEAADAREGQGALANK